jgi:tol-pal system protein YbgF
MFLFRTRVSFIILIIIAIGFSGCALKRDVDDLQQRIQWLNNENRTLQQRFDQLEETLIGRRQSENGVRDLYASQYAELEQIREELRRLNGQLDETTHRISQNMQAVGDIAQNAREAAVSNDKRLGRVERYLGFDAGKPSAADEAPAASVAPPRAEAALTETQAYAAAKQAYDEGEWDAAFKGFEAFLSRFPQSELADNSRFWIGEIYYNKGLFKEAVIEYQTVIETYPDGNKVPAAFLKQGISFHNLGEIDNARLAMQELLRRFPNANEAAIARQYMSRLQ